MLARLNRAGPRIRAVPPPAWGGVLLGAALLWVFWPTLAGMAGKWHSDPQYSHGYLVPLFAAYLLWARRNQLTPDALRPNWWGVPLLLLGLGLRFAGTYLYYDWFSAVALVPCAAGLFVLVGGWQGLRWAWPGVAFLLFMVPLPHRIEVSLAHPLQRVATLVSTYALQTLGFAAFSEGNVIRLGQVRIGVVEACSGLSMLLIFFALSTAVAILVRRPWPDRILLWLSAVPIALVANITRITVTGILHKTAGQELADLVFHELAGWLMMPLALGLLWVELRVLAWVLVPAAPRPEPTPALAGPLGLPGAAVRKEGGTGKKREKKGKPIFIPGVKGARR